MTRNLKILALAFFAVSATWALVVSAASAKQFHAEKAPLTVFGGQVGNDVFVFEAGSITCEEAKFAGPSSTVTGNEQTLQIEYVECENPIFGEVTIDAEGCDYLFTLAPGKTEGLDIFCPAGKSIKATASSCTIDIEPQEGLGSIAYDNEGTGSGRDLLVTWKVTGIKYVQTGFFCPGNGFSSSKTFSNGTYSGVTTLSGKDQNGNADGIWVE